MDLIRAQTDLALRAATEQLEGRLGRHIIALREALLGILAHVEAHIDFPDEDIDPATGAALLARIDAVRRGGGRLLGTADTGPDPARGPAHRDLRRAERRQIEPA